MKTTMELIEKSRKCLEEANARMDYAEKHADKMVNDAEMRWKRLSPSPKFHTIRFVEGGALVVPYPAKEGDKVLFMPNAIDRRAE